MTTAVPKGSAARVLGVKLCNVGKSCGDTPRRLDSEAITDFVLEMGNEDAEMGNPKAQMGETYII